MQPHAGSDLTEGLRIGTFEADATPPLGSPVAYASARSVTDPLSARGIVVLGAGPPVVLCAVDWIGIARSGLLEWRAALAAAAGTTPDRVAVQTVHQHDAPRCDFRAEELLEHHGLGGTRFDSAFARRVIDSVAEAVAGGISSARPCSALGLGTATVDRIASNRRILGPDGTVTHMRLSKSKDPVAIAAPEGRIDSLLRLVSFWDGDAPIAALSYYACHPQSYYGQGDVTSEFVGLARALRQREEPGALHVHFTGAAGNVAAGKYNDGSPERRPELRDRLADALRRAWVATARRPISASEVRWQTAAVLLPTGAHLDRDLLHRTLADPARPSAERLRAATALAYLEGADELTVLTALHLPGAHLVHLPGEPFVEYQLAAQALRPDDLVAVAGYGDYGPGYLGTAIAYGQGGYETSPEASKVTSEVDGVLTEGLRRLLL